MARQNGADSLSPTHAQRAHSSTPAQHGVLNTHARTRSSTERVSLVECISPRRSRHLQRMCFECPQSGARLGLQHSLGVQEIIILSKIVANKNDYDGRMLFNQLAAAAAAPIWTTLVYPMTRTGRTITTARADTCTSTSICQLPPRSIVSMPIV
jgi:hypothetical protein